MICLRLFNKFSYLITRVRDKKFSQKSRIGGLKKLPIRLIIIDKAVALVTKFRNQKPPENATNEQTKEWERKKLTTAKVLATIRKYITSQNVVPRKEVALVKTSYGFKLKQYAPRLLDKVEHKVATINDLILDSSTLPMPEIATEENLRQIRIDKRLIRHKR